MTPSTTRPVNTAIRKPHWASPTTLREPRPRTAMRRKRRSRRRLAPRVALARAAARARAPHRGAQGALAAPGPREDQAQGRRGAAQVRAGARPQVLQGGHVTATPAAVRRKGRTPTDSEERL